MAKSIGATFMTVEGKDGSYPMSYSLTNLALDFGAPPPSSTHLMWSHLPSYRDIIARLPPDLYSPRLAELLWIQQQCFERSIMAIAEYHGMKTQP